jgi:hypothetical protein
MKLLVTNQNVVILSLADDVQLNLTADNVNFTIIDKGPEGDLNIERKHIISQLNSSTANVIENVTAIPEGFIAGKYKFIDNEFLVVDGWIDPA